MSIRVVTVLILALFAAGGAEAKDRYFAVIPLDSKQHLDDFHIAWYSKHLAAMNEPSLWIGPVKAETYRILWLRSFHAPMAFRFTIAPDGTAELIAKKADGAGGYEPGKLVVNKVTKIDKRETLILLDALELTKFWRLASRASGIGLDGAHWVVEGVKDGKYHVVDRWSGDDIMGWALLLMNKSGEDLQPIY